MIQTNLKSNTISGYFGLSPARHDELLIEFKLIRDQQKEIVISDLLNTYNEHGLPGIGYYRVPVLNAYMALAKNETEQLYCAFMAHRELDFFTSVSETAIQNALLQNL